MKTIIATTALSALLATSAFAVGPGALGAGFLNEWDMNTDGQVTIEEVSSRRSDIFVSFDADDNGMLDAQEYAFFDEARKTSHSNQGAPARKGKGAVGMTLEFNDIDGNGSVTLEEFVSQSATWLALLDTNGDGVVMPEDFAPAQ